MKHVDLIGYPVKTALQLAPTSPGAYLFLTKDKKVLYVGKAINIRSRIRQHFSDQFSDKRHCLLIDRTSLIDWIVVTDETEALILEDALIKRFRPGFNIRFRDDKRYPLIRLSIKDDYPSLQIVRRVANDGAVYFGPYVSSRSMRLVLRVIDKYYPLRRCSGPLPQHRSRPCIYFETKRCCGPCVMHITPEEYRIIVKDVFCLLKGNNDTLIRTLTMEMNSKAEKLQFENAAVLRDQIRAIRGISKKRFSQLNKPVDIDIFATAILDTQHILEIEFIRSGTLSGSIHQIIESPHPLSENEVISKGILHYYNSGKPFPNEILVSVLPGNLSILSEFLKKVAGRSIPIFKPEIGAKARLLNMALINLQNHVSIAKLSAEKIRQSDFSSLQSLLHLNKPIHRIEAIDISETGGKHATASIVSFRHGCPEKKRYRRFKITSPGITSDLDRLRNVLDRRLSRMGLPEWSLPDMFLIDGGADHQRIAKEILKKYGIDTIPIISIAKVRNRRKQEGIFLDKGSELNLPPDTPAMLLLDRLRDEAHRFAIEYHRKIRQKETLRSNLNSVKGLGMKKRKELLRHFGSYQRLYAASIKDILQVPGIGTRLAERIFKYIDSIKRGDDS